MSDMIELVCAAHLERSNDSLVTAVEGRWAFCAGGATERHDWRQIEPSAVGSVRNQSPRGLQGLLNQSPSSSPQIA
jgi:hypothetical protein